MDLVASQQRQATNQTLQVRQGVKHPARAVAVAGLLQSAGRSPARPVARLPERPRPQQLDTEMAQLRVQRLRFEDLLSKQPQLRQIRQADGEPLTSEQNKILQAQLRTQNELLNSLLRGGDTLMLELTKLKVANGQLEDALKEINEATHRYLFWTSDVSPIGFSPAAGDRPGSAAPDLPGYHQRTGQSQRDDAYQQRDPAAAVCRPAAGWL